METVIGVSDFRAAPRLLFVGERDRLSHFYAIGRTGTGKSTLLRTLLAQDIAHGTGCTLLDPHGDLVDEVRQLVPAWRSQDLVYLDVPDASASWHFNPLADVPTEKRALATANLVEVFKKLWPDDWGPRLEHLLRNVLITLLETPGASLGDIPRLLADKDYRRGVVSRIENEEAKSFWRQEFERYTPGMRGVVVAPLQNKVGAFLSDPILRRILTGAHSSFDLREIMDDGKLLLVNLSKGQLGEGPAGLLGSLLLSSLALAGLGRADGSARNRRDFFIYLDEFHTFATLSLATMLSELRKYHVGLILAHQYLSQLKPEVRDAVFGNVGTFVSFRVGALDAPIIARELAPTFTAEDLISLPNYHIYLRLMIDGQVSKPFSAKTIGSLGEIPHLRELLGLVPRQRPAQEPSLGQAHMG